MPRPPLLCLLAAAVLPTACSTRPDTDEARQLQMYGLVQKFDRFDANGDGFLSRRELRDGILVAGSLQLTDAELTQVMQAYDVNHDGRISQREAQLAAERGPGIFKAR